MRKVSIDMLDFSLAVGDKLKFELIDSVGNLHTTTSGYSLNEEIILEDTSLVKEFLESEYIDVAHFYRLTLQNSLSFTFIVPSTTDDSTHDLISLFQLACYKGIINQEEKKLSQQFINKLDFYFTGENPHFTKTEKDVVRLYEYYANKVKSTTSTIDIMKMMDEYLATIGLSK